MRGAGAGSVQILLKADLGQIEGPKVQHDSLSCCLCSDRPPSMLLPLLPGRGTCMSCRRQGWLQALCLRASRQMCHHVARLKFFNQQIMTQKD